MTITKTEPVSLSEAFRALILTTLGLLQAFNVMHLSNTQQAVVLAEFAAVSIALSALSRSRVTPVAAPAISVPLTTTPGGN